MIGQRDLSGKGGYLPRTAGESHRGLGGFHGEAGRRGQEEEREERLPGHRLTFAMG